MIKHHQDVLDKLQHRRETLSQERVPIQVIIVKDDVDARQVFVDINDDAKGVTGSILRGSTSAKS